MTKRIILAGASALALSAIFTVGHVAPASALTMKECSTKYQAAKTAGTLNGLKWNDFRAKECDSDTTAATTPAAATPAKATKASKTDDFEEPAAPTTAAPRGVSFPRAVAAKYSTEAAGKARMHTCVDSYNDNKAKGTLAGLKWIQKGGGFYSLCNARLKSNG